MGVGVLVLVGVGVAVAVRVLVGVSVGVRVAVGVRVTLAVFVGERVAVTVAVGGPPGPQPVSVVRGPPVSAAWFTLLAKLPPQEAALVTFA